MSTIVVEGLYSEPLAKSAFQACSKKLRVFRLQRAEYTRVYRELSSLTDTELASLKIARPMISQIARSASNLT